MSYADFCLKSIKRSCVESNSCTALFYPPKVALIEAKRFLKVINIEEEQDSNNGLELESDVIDWALNKQFIWLILKNGILFVYDINENLHLEVEIDNGMSYKIKTDRENLFLESQCGELFHIPYSIKELQLKLKEGSKTVLEPLLKSRTRRQLLLYSNDAMIQKKNMHLMDLQVAWKQNTLIAECPLTGMCAISAPTSETTIEDIVPWENVIAAKGDNCIWVIELNDGQKLLSLQTQCTVYLLDHYKNSVYYLATDSSSVHIKYITQVSGIAEDAKDGISCKNEEFQKLSMQATLKQEMHKLVTLILSSVNYNITNAINELNLYFDKIDDLDFLIENSILLCQSDLAFKTLLLLLREKTENVGEQLQKKLQHVIIKFELLEYIKINGKTKYYQLNIFECNYQNLCYTFISNADLDLATITWLKWFRTNPVLAYEDIESLLYCVPSNIKMNTLMVWLKAFIPSLIDINPFYIDMFVKWATERVFSMETSGYWPKIAIKFIEELKFILKDSHKEIAVSPPTIDDLDSLKVHLCNIKELKEKYKINLLVRELSSQTPAEVVLIMFHRCYTEDLERLLSDYLPTYASRHSVDLDAVLSAHVEREATRGGGAADDTRLTIFLAAFRSQTHRYECLLHVLKALDVPWSYAVQKLAIEAAASYSNDYLLTETDRILSRQIEIELNYACYRIVLKKYNFSEHCTDYILILHKIVDASLVDLVDLKAVMRVMRGFNGYGSILFMDKCLKDCKTRTALDYYNELSKKEQKIVVKSLFRKLEFMIKDNIQNFAVIERNYIDFLKGTSALTEIEIDNIENLYHLKNSHQINTNVNDMYCEENCENIYSKWSTKSDSQTKLCINNIRSTRIVNDIEMMKYLSLCANKKSRLVIEVLIKEVLASGNKSNSCEKTALLHLFKDNENSHLLLDCCKVLIQLIFNCSEEHIHDFVKVFSILNTINCNLVIKNLMAVWKFNYIYIPISTISAIDDLIQFYIEIDLNRGFEAKLLKTFDTKSDFVYYRILSQIVYNCLAENTTIDYNFVNARRKFVKKIITKILAYQEHDEVFLTSLLLMIDIEENSDTYMTDSALVAALGIHGETSCSALTTYLCKPSVRQALGFDDPSAKCTNITPYHLLKLKCNINISEFPLPDVIEETWDVRRILFYVLNSHHDIPLESLIGLCRVVNVAIDDGLYLQIVTILTTWELEYKVFFDDLKRKQIIFLNEEKSLYSRCLPFWDSINNKKPAIEVLKELWESGEVSLYGHVVSINPYYYEVYLTIYNLLCSVLPEWQTMKESYLLYFLQQYKRSGSPKQYEFELFSIKGVFPEIGQYRLPFQLFMRDDMWANLKSEITLETYERWLPTVALLSLDADEQTARDILCSNALKQTMTERKQSNEADSPTGSEAWRLEAREEPLLRAAHRCVRHIANMEWAGACLFYVLQGCTRGADQVAAAQLCYQFAQRWAALHPANRAVLKMQRIYTTLSTRHALHKVQWACDELLRLIAEPAQLVRTLYLHPSFVEQMTLYDVNNTANEISEKNGINISSIRIQILENILEQNETSKTNTLGLDIEELMRAKCILKATCPKMSAIYLARIALDEEVDFNKAKKMRALQCLISVVDPDTVIKVTNKKRELLWHYLLELYYATQLENAGMPWAGAALTSDKTQVLEQLLSGTHNNIEHLKLSAQLTRRYGNAVLARKLFTSLTRAGLLDEVASLLVKYNTSGEEVRQAWKAVLLGPFQRADYPITDKQRAYCLKAINMVLLFEDITDEDLKIIWKNCIRCKCYALGCLILPYMSVRSRKELVEFEKLDKRNIIAGIKNLHNDTYLVNSAMSIIESILYKRKF